MEFEVLKKSHLTRNILIGVLVVGVISAVILNFTRAKYRVTQSIPLVNGTINYTPYDFKMVAMYQEDESGEYIEVEVMPSSGYVINETESYCTVDNVNKDEEAILYTDDEGQHVIGNLKKGSKCYLYFDEYEIPTAGDVLLSNYSTVLTRNNFDITMTNSSSDTVYYADTSKGRTYYFAGNPTDNWVQFGGFYWRIIRINEDGTIRLIYQGTSIQTIGTGTQIQESSFNNSYDNSIYVGYMYTSGSAHGLGRSSTIKEVLEQWYRNNLTRVADKIDGNAGFCGDRTSSPGTGLWITYTYYGAYVRLSENDSSPSFECQNSSDLYTTKGSAQGNVSLDYPIGLVSLDEVWYAGGYTSANQSYYLYTNQTYWTMSPYYFDGTSATLFAVASHGGFYGDLAGSISGVRPVINLKADVQISTGNGTSSDPYVIA